MNNKVDTTWKLDMLALAVGFFCMINIAFSFKDNQQEYREKQQKVTTEVADLFIHKNYDYESESI